MKISTFAALALAAANSALAALKINNWSGDTIYYYINNNPARTVIGPHSIGTYNFDTSGAAMSVKISKMNSLSAAEGNCMQYEYNVNDGTLWYDLSLINGGPFSSGNVKVSPTGNVGTGGACTQVKCVAGQPCHDAYIQSNDNWATRNCPANTGDMWIDIAEPTANFNSRDVHFSA